MLENIDLLGDSSCDLTREQKHMLNFIESVPFYIQIGGDTITDDDTINIQSLIAKMKAATGRMTTACASPQQWKEIFVKSGGGFAVTLSSKLSGMHQSAVMGLEMAREEITGLIGHVFDSKSASSGEVLLAMKIREFANETSHVPALIDRVNRFVENMKTLFVLDDISNLVKNGRLSKIKGTIVTALGIKPVFGAKDGEIEIVGRVRGSNKVAAKIMEVIEATQKAGKTINGDTLVISHCRNPELAEEIASSALSKFKFGRAYVQETGGLSSFYAADKGVILSF